LFARANGPLVEGFVFSFCLHGAELMRPDFATECWFLSGPTASGKTSIGVVLAGRVGGEILSMDSMAVYRGMDVGTAKPTETDRGGVAHHLIDIADPCDPFSLADYLDAAAERVRRMEAEGKTALFVGGTPLYLKALLRGVFDGPPADWDLRNRLMEEAASASGLFLYERLKETDPESAARLHPNDARRLIRAIEVFEKTGRPISALQRQFETARPRDACRVFVLDWNRDALYRRIDRRVEEMLAAGLVEEVRRLLAGPRPPGRTALQAVGYREVVEHLQRGTTRFEMVEAIKRNTRRFAKRQLTWFRGLDECRFIPVNEADTHDDVVERILAQVDTP